MKKIGLLLIAFAIATTNFAQITTDVVISSDNIRNSELIELENSGAKYYIFDAENMFLRLYNIDHSIFKTVNIDVSSLGFDGFTIFKGGLYPFAISENLFNTDNKFEFIISIHAFTDDYSNEKLKTVILNEDGNILYEKENYWFGNGLTNQYPDLIKNTNNGTKLILKRTSDIDNDSLLILNLPGTVPCFNCDQTNKIHNVNNKSTSLSNYPNPAKNYTIIEYEIPKGENEAEIQIFNMNGQLVKTYKVDKTFKNLRISTSDFENGTYIYNIKTKNMLSKGNKLIINK